MTAGLPHPASQEVAGKRVFLDVSVLLAALLDPGSPSNQLIALSSQATLILSPHVERVARAVLIHNAPLLLPEFNDGMLQLTMHMRIERIAEATKELLPDWASALRGEDAQVLADAIAGHADFLFTHDRDFFLGLTPGLEVRAPYDHVWSGLAGSDVRTHPDHFTFLSWFIPHWGSIAMRQSRELFYILEVSGILACFYEADRGRFRLRWDTPTAGRSGVSIRMEVEAGSYNYVGIVVSLASVALFVNGVWREAHVRLGRPGSGATIHPFNSAKGEHQIFGGMRFRFFEVPLPEKTVRRHYEARSLMLSDGEANYAEAARSIILA